MLITNASQTFIQPSRPAWYATWFDSKHYHALYAHRDDAEAATFVDAVADRLQLAPRASVLDLGCGSGRHARRLAAHGLDVTGLDLAASSLRQAARYETATLRFRRQDMRLPLGWQSYDCVCSFFTSFGYFEDSSDHLTVIRNVSRALKPGGTFVLDYLNAEYADQHLVADETRAIHGVVYRIARWTDGRHFFKRITVDDSGADEPIEYQERVARFTLPDFRRMFALYGLDLVEWYGDYALRPFDPGSSPRLILMARPRLIDSATLSA